MNSPASLSHFLDLLEHGNCPGASSGELRARRIALTLVHDLPGLDCLAVAGLCEFIVLLDNDRRTVIGLLSGKQQQKHPAGSASNS